MIFAAAAMFLLAACHNNDDEEKDILSERTVLVYMSGENNLSSGIIDDINEMLQVKNEKRDHILLIYVDEANKRRMPYLARIRNGREIDSVSIKDMGISNGDTCSVAPDVMKAIISYAFHKYPSRNNDYGLVLWGHASGWTIEDSIAPKNQQGARQHRAYGYDTGQDTKSKAAWINIHSLAQVLSQTPHLKFIFADCCNFQSIESLYELRHVADYIIGSPAEIPGEGAPYETVVPAMFEPDTFYTAIINRYYEQKLSNNCRVPLSAVKTSAMDALAEATRVVLESMKDTLNATPYPDVTGLIHYYYTQLYNDANDFVLRYAKPEAYATWKKALDDAVIYKKMATKWTTNTVWDYNYNDFEMTEERYGGVSMFVPQDPNRRGGYRQYNENINKTAWYYAVGMKNLGW